LDCSTHRGNHDFLARRQTKEEAKAAMRKSGARLDVYLLVTRLRGVGLQYTQKQEQP
jgi:hypothetical protein